MKERVSNTLKKLRTTFQKDDGDIELIDVNKDGVVLIKLKGIYKSCPDLRVGINVIIENLLMNEVQGINSVLAI
jgi:Fe-S cluster biogenesis protein NfuA